MTRPLREGKEPGLTQRLAVKSYQILRDSQDPKPRPWSGAGNQIPSYQVQETIDKLKSRDRNQETDPRGNPKSESRNRYTLGKQEYHITKAY